MWRELDRAEKVEMVQVTVACLVGVPVGIVLFAILMAFFE